jgi:peptidoglycan hydrolase CwlO-like protein
MKLSITAGLFELSMKLNKLLKELSATEKQMELEKTYQPKVKDDLTELQSKIEKTIKDIKSYGKVE